MNVEQHHHHHYHHHHQQQHYHHQDTNIQNKSTNPTNTFTTNNGRHTMLSSLLAKHNIPCKYFTSGKCAYGNNCRFLHVDISSAGVDDYKNTDEYFNEAVRNEENAFAEEGAEDNDHGYIMDAHDEKSMSVNANGHYYQHQHHYHHQHHHHEHVQQNINNTNVSSIPHYKSLQQLKNEFNQVSQVLLGFKPLLHIVVLFAGDIRVRNYLEQVQENFLSNGINVYTQMTTDTWEAIRPNNLQEIISSSTADYLVVIGDRNMKHRTCHAKRSGKLCEETVDERVQSILDEWAQNPSVNKAMNEIFQHNVEDLSKEQIQELIQSFAQIRHIKDRITRLRNGVGELREWRAPKVIKDDHHTVTDEKMLAKLTSAQNAAIRLHRDLDTALDIIQGIPVDDTQGANLRRGMLLNTTTIEKSQIGVSSNLKDKIIAECEDLLPKVERLGNQLSEVANNASLWEAYRIEYREKKKKKQMLQQQQQQQQFDDSSTNISNSSKQQGSGTSTTTKKKQKRKNNQKSPGTATSIGHDSNSWACKKCTYINICTDANCEMCNNPKPVDEEWSVNIKKKNKKKQKEEEVIKPQQQSSKITPTGPTTKPRGSISAPEEQPSAIKIVNNARVVPATISSSSTNNAWQTAETKAIGVNPVSVPTILQKNKNIPAKDCMEKTSNLETTYAALTSTPLQQQTLNYEAEYPSLGGKKQKQQNTAQIPVANADTNINFIGEQYLKQSALFNLQQQASTSSDFLRQIANMKITHQDSQQFPPFFMQTIQQQVNSSTGASDASSMDNTPILRSPIDSPIPSAIGSDVWGVSNTGALHTYAQGNMTTRFNSAFDNLSSYQQFNDFTAASSPVLSNIESNGSSRSSSTDLMNDPIVTAANSFHLPGSVWSNDIMNVSNYGSTDLYGSPASISDQWSNFNSGRRASAGNHIFGSSRQPSSSLFSSVPSTWQQPPFGHSRQQFSSYPLQQQQNASLDHLITTDGDDFADDMTVPTEVNNLARRTSLGPSSLMATSPRANVSNTGQPNSRPRSERPINQPCAVCGKESLLECADCANLRKKGLGAQGTFFCSTEHQILAWQDHQKYHDEILSGYNTFI
jgi:hypothetical protein